MISVATVAVLFLPSWCFWLFLVKECQIANPSPRTATLIRPRAGSLDILSYAKLNLNTRSPKTLNPQTTKRKPGAQHLRGDHRSQFA